VYVSRSSQAPSLAFRMIETMCQRVRELTNEIVELKAQQEQA